MTITDSAWRLLVDEFISSLSALDESAAGVQQFSIAQLEQSERGTTLALTADAHLKNSQRVRAYLEPRIAEPEAREALMRVAEADLEAASLLDAASEEPDRAFDAFSEVRSGFDIESLRGDLVGGQAIAGAQSTPPALQTVQAHCDAILGQAGDSAKELAVDLGRAVTLNQVLDGAANLVGGKVGALIGKVKAGVGLIKSKVLDFIAEAMSKIAAWFGVDEDVTKELAKLWEKISGPIANWTADILGQSRAEEAWQEWLSRNPRPSQDDIDKALAAVEQTFAAHTKYLSWASRAIWLYGKISGSVAAALQAGPLVVALVAAGLGGWIAGTTWDFLRDTERAAG